MVERINLSVPRAAADRRIGRPLAPHALELLGRTGADEALPSVLSTDLLPKALDSAGRVFFNLLPTPTRMKSTRW
jgi:hypothetical protein